MASGIDQSKGGFAYYVSDEQLAAYARLTPYQRLCWVEEIRILRYSPERRKRRNGRSVCVGARPSSPWPVDRPLFSPDPLLVSDQTDEPAWRRVGTPEFLIASGVFAGFFLLLSRANGFLPILDHANLAFHEAGHIFFRILGETASLYGGTLGQLVFPGVAIVVLWRRRETLGLAIAGIWFFENFLNIAVYMADARTQALPLVGGGDHDWTNILGRWNALASDTSLARKLRALGWIGMIGMWGWLGLRWLGDRQRD